MIDGFGSPSVLKEERGAHWSKMDYGEQLGLAAPLHAVVGTPVGIRKSHEAARKKREQRILTAVEAQDLVIRCAFLKSRGRGVIRI